jgi:hypothetical protein
MIYSKSKKNKQSNRLKKTRKNNNASGSSGSSSSKNFIRLNCSPNKDDSEKNEFSCYSKENLIKIRNMWNQYYPNKKIKSSNYYVIWNDLKENMKNTCNKESCWLKQRFIEEKGASKKLLESFLPETPESWKKNPNEWLSNIDINNVLKNYEKAHKDFEFLGPSPIDFKYKYNTNNCVCNKLCNFNISEKIKKKINKIGIIFNLDPHYKGGSHWVSLFVDIKKAKIYYFDSVGSPPLKLTKKFITRVAKYMYKKKYKEELPVNNVLKIFKSVQNLPEDKLSIFINKKKYVKNLVNHFDIRYNNIQHQFSNSECGVYSINFIINLASGKKFDDVINDVKRDDIMNENRKVFFRNIN